MRALLVHPKTANPLYLQVILEELRIFGDFDKLESHFDGYLQAETIPALYEKVLGRLEADFQPEGFPHLVEDALCLLWAARHGLEESIFFVNKRLIKGLIAVWHMSCLGSWNRRGRKSFCGFVLVVFRCFGSSRVIKYMSCGGIGWGLSLIRRWLGLMVRV
jgi:hypothetical protein